MSLAIDVNEVDMVLLIDGWHEVANASFTLDAYEYADEDRMLLKGDKVAGVPTTGATWTESDGTVIACPVTSILATKSAPRRR